MVEKTYKNIVVLTGAGISQESGLKTFRDDDGLWEGRRIEEFATPEAFASNPALVYEFYNLRRAQLKEIQPNAAHLALAEFERSFNGSYTLITQNVDNLHERAGSSNIIHIHGELTKIRCCETGEVFSWHGHLDQDSLHPKTGQRALLRPHICWFGEIPYEMDRIYNILQQADLFLAIGTSGVVYPAAAFVSVVSNQCKTVLINKEDALNNPLFDEVILGPATCTVPDYFRGVL